MGPRIQRSTSGHCIAAPVLDSAPVSALAFDVPVSSVVDVIVKLLVAPASPVSPFVNEEEVSCPPLAVLSTPGPRDRCTGCGRVHVPVVAAAGQ